MKASSFVSGHLEAPRRELYRSRRDEALISCGIRTSVLTTQDRSTPVGALILMSPSAYHPDASGYIWLAGTFSHSLRVGPNAIGRQRGNDIVIGDEAQHVSRRHCVLVMHADGTAEVFDLASLNGTYVNDTRIADRAVLTPHDTLRLGSTVRFRLALYDRNGH